jgi:hypothetical protein
MKELGRSGSRVSQQGERKQRSVKLLAGNSSDGNMRLAVHTIKQRTCVKMEILFLGRLTQHCDHYLCIIPARPVKEELAKIAALDEVLNRTSSASPAVPESSGSSSSNNRHIQANEGNSMYDPILSRMMLYALTLFRLQKYLHTIIGMGTLIDIP